MDFDLVSSIGDGFFIRTAKGIIPRNILNPVSRDGNGSGILPTDRGESIHKMILISI